MKEFNITINGESYVVGIEELEGGPSTGALHTTTAKAAPAAKAAAPAVKAAPEAKAAKASAPVAAGAATVKAPMPGKIISIAVSAGQSVKRGDVLLILEAMKMQNEISAPADGKVSTVQVSAGQSVKPGEVLIVLE